jgi:hypothetical protein
MDKSQTMMSVTLAMTLGLFTELRVGADADPSGFIDQTNMQGAEFQPQAKATWSQQQTEAASQWIDLWAAYRILQNERIPCGLRTRQLEWVE